MFAVAALLGNLSLQLLSAPLLQLLWAWSSGWWWLLLPLLMLGRWRGGRLLLTFLLFFFWSGWSAQQQLKTLDPALQGVEILLVGAISSLPEEQGRGLRHLFSVESATLAGEAVTVPELLRLSWYETPPQPLAVAQRWQLLVKLKEPWGMLNPAGFDYEQWLFSEGIGATGYVRRHAALNQRLAEDAKMPLQQLRGDLQQRLYATLANPRSESGALAVSGEAMRGILAALLLGERGDISAGQWQLFLQTGTNHLMAISGLHVGLVATLVFFLMRWFWTLLPGAGRYLAAPRFAALIALLAALFYAALAGFSVPTQRAVMMAAVALGAIFFCRPVQPLQLLAVALLAVLLVQPLATLTPGFWLSFTAVAAIFYLLRGRSNRVLAQWSAQRWWGGVLQRSWQLVLLQLTLFLALMPLTAHFFGLVSLAAPLANIVAVPWVTLAVVPLLLLGALLLYLLPALAALLLQLAALAMVWLLNFLGWLQPQLAAVTLQSPTLLATCMALLGVAWFAAPAAWPARWLGLLALLPWWLSLPERPEAGTAAVTLLDVGQGLAVVVETQQHLLVYDSGPRFGDGFDAGRMVVAPLLRQHGWQAIDLLMISHGDLDHIGGAQALSELFTVNQMVTAVPQQVSWQRAAPCEAGQQWQWDGVTLTLLHPAASDSALGENDRSCVLQIEANGQRLLLTGDIEKGGEQQLLQRQADHLAADYLIAPHHGSRSSSTLPFVKAVAPKWVFFPAGYLNRYHFPATEVVARYREQGAQLITTGTAGAIIFTLGAANREPPKRYRFDSPPYWRRGLATDDTL
ncbi:MAG: DNA internalization-related competence protein ComEC/Rec2 [Gammaproteobacteria bacterium]|nr:DNA internalization-related competence protein ComEC/Rec2 [Gammaproteobacteria bacterium]